MAICLVHMAVQYIIPPHPGLMVTPCLLVPCCSEAVFSADFPQASSHLDAKLLWPPPWLLLGPRHAYTNTHQKPTHTHTLTLSHLVHTAVRHTLSATCQKQGILRHTVYMYMTRLDYNSTLSNTSRACTLLVQIQLVTVTSNPIENVLG